MPGPRSGVIRHVKCTCALPPFLSVAPLPAKAILADGSAAPGVRAAWHFPALYRKQKHHDGLYPTLGQIAGRSSAKKPPSRKPQLLSAVLHLSTSNIAITNKTAQVWWATKTVDLLPSTCKSKSGCPQLMAFPSLSHQNGAPCPNMMVPDPHHATVLYRAPYRVLTV